MAGKESRESQGHVESRSQEETILEEIKNAHPLELQSDRKKKTGARPSEIRRFLLRFAAKKGIIVKEHFSDTDGQAAWFTHIELRDKNGAVQKTATAVSYEHGDNSLVMGFLNLYNPEIDFLS